jgi:hypothetical protein
MHTPIVADQRSVGVCPTCPFLPTSPAVRAESVSGVDLVETTLGQVSAWQAPFEPPGLRSLLQHKSCCWLDGSLRRGQEPASEQPVRPAERQIIQFLPATALHSAGAAISSS